MSLFLPVEAEVLATGLVHLLLDLANVLVVDVVLVAHALGSEESVDNGLEGVTNHLFGALGILVKRGVSVSSDHFLSRHLPWFHQWRVEQSGLRKVG